MKYAIRFLVGLLLASFLNAQTVTSNVQSGPITSSKLTMATASLLGRTTASTGAIEQISIGTSLTLSAGSLNAVQDVRTTASPTFATPVVTSLALGATTPGTIGGSSGDINITTGAVDKTIVLTSAGANGVKVVGGATGLVIVADSNNSHLIFRNSSAPSTNVVFNYLNGASLIWYGGNGSGINMTLKGNDVLQLNAVDLNIRATSNVTGVRTAVATLDFPRPQASTPASS